MFQVSHHTFSSNNWGEKKQSHKQHFLQTYNKKQWHPSLRFGPCFRVSPIPEYRDMWVDPAGPPPPALLRAGRCKGSGADVEPRRGKVRGTQPLRSQWSIILHLSSSLARSCSSNISCGNTLFTLLKIITQTINPERESSVNTSAQGSHCNL